jgi:hypothetical protein
LSSTIVIPIFFYKIKTQLFWKCFTLDISFNPTKSRLQIKIPSNISFRNRQLLSLPNEDLDSTFSEITLLDGTRLEDVCDSLIEGKNTVVFSFTLI